MTWKNGELDSIEVRYIVEATFEVHGPDGMHGCADASFSMTCGVYSGVPDKQNMADLITSRTVDADDIDNIVGDYDADRLSDIISMRGVKAKEIRTMRIQEVTYNEETIAQNIEEDQHE